MTKVRYWTQFGFTPKQALDGWDLSSLPKASRITSPWSSQTKYYMENIIRNSSLFFIDKGFWYDDILRCMLFDTHPDYIQSNIKRRNYLGYYFDHELQGK